MRRPDLLVFVAATATIAFGTAGAERVRAAGYWNMPGTLPQRVGHGYGGGYHAPFILGPIKLDGWGLPNEVRLPCAPAPCCCTSSCGSCGCGREPGRVIEPPRSMEGAVPTAAPPSAPPQVQASPAAPAADSPPVAAATTVESTRPLFDPPVQP